jgi:hypothetical protein
MPRKEKKAEPPTASIVFVGLLCFFVVAAGGGYLWNKSQIHTLGEQYRGYEIRLDSAKRYRATLERNYATNCSRFYLEMLVKRMRLEIGPPQPDQIVRLPERAGDEQDEKLMAGQTSPTPAEEGRN